MATPLTGGGRAVATPLVINSMHGDPTAKHGFTALLDEFLRRNPDIQPTVNVVDHESYKVQIRTWLPNDPPDVVTWFGGNRARFFVEKGLVEPLDDIWNDIAAEVSPATRELVSFHGHTYLIPSTYYQWGFYYRKDLFAAAGIATAPATWPAFLQAIKLLKAAHLQPITIGTRQGWPAAAWFEYLDLRRNGYAFHNRLVRGEESYLSPQVKGVMQAWRELIELGAFSTSAPALTWQEASAALWQGRAAMYLMGNFISTEIPAELAGKVGFFPFPQLDPAVPPAEVAPVDVYFLPAKAQHKAEAKRFLRFVATPAAQAILARITNLLPTNLLTPLTHPDEFMLAGQELLKRAVGLTQFFDRDAEPQVAKVGLDGFVEFMIYPDHEMRVLERLERARLRFRSDP